MENIAVTELPHGRAKGVTKRTAPQAAAAMKKPAKSKPKSTAAPAATSPKPSAVFTTADIVRERGISPKTLRARMRRQIDLWGPLFKDGQKHTFSDNAATRAAVARLLG